MVSTAFNGVITWRFFSTTWLCSLVFLAATSEHSRRGVERNHQVKLPEQSRTTQSQ